MTILLIILIISYLLDGIIRKRVYIKDILETNKKTSEDFIKKFTGIRNEINEAWNQLVDTNCIRYGLDGKMNFDDIVKNTKYGVSGTPMKIGAGVVFNKIYISKEEIVNNIATVYQRSKGNVQIMASSDSIDDKYIVSIFTKDHLKKYVISDIHLFNNVERGDEVTLSYNDEMIFTVGYRLKDGYEEKIIRKKLDMEKL